jgi:hypothetical protein
MGIAFILNIMYSNTSLVFFSYYEMNVGEELWYGTCYISEHFYTFHLFVVTCFILKIIRDLMSYIGNIKNRCNFTNSDQFACINTVTYQGIRFIRCLLSPLLSVTNLMVTSQHFKAVYFSFHDSDHSKIMLRI